MAGKPPRKLWETTIEEDSREGTSVVSAASSVTSSKTLKLENERLRAELEKLRASKTASREAASSSSAMKTSSRTRLEVEVLKEELHLMKLKSKVEERKFAMKAREEEIGHLIKSAQTLDLAFLFDATSSMQQSIDEVKDTITKIAAGIGSSYPEAMVRVGFVVYRDYEDKVDYREECDFTSSFKGSRSEFVTALSRVSARCGGDDAEDVFTGLERVTQMSWNATNRVLFHIADAPCHGAEFHCSNIGDKYAEGDMLGRNINDLLQRLHDKSQITVYFFCHLNKYTEKMLKEFRKSEAGKGDWIQEGLFQDVKKIPPSVVSTCKDTIFKTLSTVGKGHSTGTKLVPCEVDPAIPKWSSVSTQTGYQLKHKRIGNLEGLLSKIRSGQKLDLEISQNVQVQIAPHPFSSDGATRWPYYARVSDENEERMMVLKRFKTRWGEDTREVHSREKYLEQMEVQTVSAELAEEFNKITRKLGASKQVLFPLVSTLTTGVKYYNMEKVLLGEWTKYSSNGGYVNTTEYAATVQAFSHWTHECSKGDVMVTDLQGVQIQTTKGAMEFVLSDPAIHSTNVLRFTRTNLGSEGFKLFYKSHMCNDVCRKLRLTPSTNGYTTDGTMLS